MHLKHKTKSHQNNQKQKYNKWTKTHTMSHKNDKGIHKLYSTYKKHHVTMSEIIVNKKKIHGHLEQTSKHQKHVTTNKHHTN
jgi:hypothetical protein